MLLFQCVMTESIFQVTCLTLVITCNNLAERNAVKSLINIQSIFYIALTQRTLKVKIKGQQNKKPAEQRHKRLNLLQDRKHSLHTGL